jgi:DNA polymerase III delta prime subunit
MARTGTARLPLSERLRPAHLDAVAGNPRARSELRAWASGWEGPSPPARRAALLIGPPGVGKTSSALALAADLGWTVVEMNASDARNQTAIEEVAGRASITHTLNEFAGARRSGKALILLDEADCLTGRLTETARTVPKPPTLREFLRARYRDVAALNEAWGLGAGGPAKAFADWEAVPRTAGTAAWARAPAARHDLDDWRGLARHADSSDRGGLGAIARLVRTTRQPLLLTVNDERSLTRYSAVFRTAVVRIRFDPIRAPDLARHLAGIVRQEGIAVGPGVLERIVERSHGDLRAALNDLEAIAPLPPGPGQEAVLGTRDVGADFARIVEEALSVPRFYRSGEVRDRLDAPPDDLLPWIEENIPWFAPDAVHQAWAIDRLAAADRFLTRARRSRVWGQWSYATEILTGGVGLALHERAGPAGREAGFPRFLGEMGRSRETRALRDAVAARVGARFHVSRAAARSWGLPLLERLVEPSRVRGGAGRSSTLATRIASELELTPEGSAYLLGLDPGELEPPPESEPPASGEKSGEPSPPDRTEPSPDAEAVGARPRRKVQRSLGEYAR